MKKLEKMDGKLFESLKPNEMTNLAAFVGGTILTTCGTQDFQVGNKIYTKKYTDKQKGQYIDKIGWVDEGCPYDHVYYKPVYEPSNLEVELFASVDEINIDGQ